MEENDIKKKKKTTKNTEDKKNSITKKEILESKRKTTVKKEVQVSKEKKKEEDKIFLDNKSQKLLKTLSKIVSILAKIGRIALMICIPFIFIAMIMIPFALKPLEISDNVITYNDARVTINDDNISVKIVNNDEKTYQDKELVVFAKAMMKYSKGDILIISEVSLAFVAGIVLINLYILMYVERLFKNIGTEDTPFTLENTNYIRKIGQVMIIIAIVSLIFEIMLGIFFPDFKAVRYSTYGVMPILVIFIIHYIFKYATNLQKEVKAKIYK